MPDLFANVGAFHEKFGLPHYNVIDKPQALDAETQKFRSEFLQEELSEYEGAVNALALVSEEDEYREVLLAAAFDALIDLVYVALGTAHLHGFPFDEGWFRVQEANMAKVRAQPDGSDSKRGSSLDVVKPDGWKAPNLVDLVK